MIFFEFLDFLAFVLDFSVISHYLQANALFNYCTIAWVTQDTKRCQAGPKGHQLEVLVVDISVALKSCDMLQERIPRLPAGAAMASCTSPPSQLTLYKQVKTNMKPMHCNSFVPQNGR